MDGLQRAIVRARIKDFGPVNGHAEPAPEPIAVKVVDKPVNHDPVSSIFARVDALEARMRELFPPQNAEPKPRLTPSCDEIKRAVCALYRVTELDLICERRLKHLIEARHVAMYLCCQLTRRSLPFIGKLFGNRDHSSIHHARQRIGARRQTDDVLNGKLEQLKARVTGQA